MEQLWRDVGIGGAGALAVACSAAVMYAVFALVLSVWGDHLRTSTSPVTAALAALLGAICARATLGNYPNAGGGLVALATLLVLERIFGVLASAARRDRRERRRGRRTVRR